MDHIVSKVRYIVYHSSMNYKRYTATASFSSTIQLNYHLQLRLQPRVPSRPIRALQRPFPSIPKQRTKLEPLLATANAVNTPLMSQVHILPYRQPLRILVAQDDSPGSLGFSNDVDRPGFVQEAVMDAAGIPCVDAVCPAEGVVAYEGVAATVVGVGVVVGAVVIFLVGG